MTTITPADLDLLRARMATAIGGRMAGHIERLGWSRGQLAGLQRARLRALLAHAIDRSPFHAARLAGIDAARFELTDVAQLPIMTKAQMMNGFNEVVTDRRLTRELVDQHIAASSAEPSLLFGDYVCLVSGGSSGLRGVFVQTAEEYAEFTASVIRRAMAAFLASGGHPADGMVTGICCKPRRCASTRFARRPAAPTSRWSPAPVSTMPHWRQRSSRVCARRVTEPHVTISRAGAIARDPRTGKVRRFVPGEPAAFDDGLARLPQASSPRDRTVATRARSSGVSMSSGLPVSPHSTSVRRSAWARRNGRAPASPWAWARTSSQCSRAMRTGLRGRPS